MSLQGWVLFEFRLSSYLVQEETRSVILGRHNKHINKENTLIFEKLLPLIKQMGNREGNHGPYPFPEFSS